MYFPQELTEMRRWCLWQLENDKKIPMLPAGPYLRKADCTKADNALTFEQARYWVEKGKCNGLGVILDSSIDGTKLCCIDIDGCINNGSFTQTAQDILSISNGTWTEISQSGRGIHLFFFDDNFIKSAKKKPVEVYGNGRFIAMTGNTLTGHTVKFVNGLCNEVISKYCSIASINNPTTPPVLSLNESFGEESFGEEDEKLVKYFCSDSCQKKDYNAWLLFNGKTAEYFEQKNSIVDDSVADFDLILKIFFYVDKRNATDEEKKQSCLRIFNQSILAQRDKWQNRFDYRQRTLTRAFEVHNTNKKEGEKIDMTIKSKGFFIEDYFKKEFFENPEKDNVFYTRKSGFVNLDAKQIFLSGLYLIGGIPSIGKTTFCQQFISQFSKNENTPCVFVSCEMSKESIACKSLARMAYKNNPNTKITAANARQAEIIDSEELNQTVECLVNEGCRVYILEHIGGIDSLFEELKKFNYENPVVVIDYMQIISSSNKSENIRQSIDDTAQKLKQYSRETGTTFIIVSSLNRQNYKNSIDFEAFKDSGGLEYAADVVWGLEYHIPVLKSDGTPDINPVTLGQAKLQNPRSVNLVCLKNRFGGLYTCNFDYYPANDYFEPTELF